MDPPTHVRVVLAEARRRDLSFEAAWTMAVQSLPRKSEPDRFDAVDWNRHLIWARPAFRAAYLGVAVTVEAPAPRDWDADPRLDETSLAVADVAGSPGRNGGSAPVPVQEAVAAA